MRKECARVSPGFPRRAVALWMLHSSPGPFIRPRNVSYWEPPVSQTLLSVCVCVGGGSSVLLEATHSVSSRWKSRDRQEAQQCIQTAINFRTKQGADRLESELGRGLSTEEQMMRPVDLSEQSLQGGGYENTGLGRAWSRNSRLETELMGQAMI